MKTTTNDVKIDRRPIFIGAGSGDDVKPYKVTDGGDI